MAEFRVFFGTGLSGHAKADHQPLYAPGDTFRNLATSLSVGGATGRKWIFPFSSTEYTPSIANRW
jgi:hypothetical protein